MTDWFGSICTITSPFTGQKAPVISLFADRENVYFLTTTKNIDRTRSKKRFCLDGKMFGMPESAITIDKIYRAKISEIHEKKMFISATNYEMLLNVLLSERQSFNVDYGNIFELILSNITVVKKTIDKNGKRLSKKISENKQKNTKKLARVVKRKNIRYGY